MPLPSLMMRSRSPSQTCDKECMEANKKNKEPGGAVSSYLHIRDAAARAGMTIPDYQNTLPPLEAQGLVARKPGGYLQFATPEQRTERRRVAQARVRDQKKLAAEERAEQRREANRKLVLAVVKIQFSPSPARAVDIAMSLSRTRAWVESVAAELVQQGRLTLVDGGYALPAEQPSVHDWPARKHVLDVIQQRFDPAPAQIEELADAAGVPVEQAMRLVDELLSEGRLTHADGGYLLPGSLKSWLEHSERQQFERSLRKLGVVRQ